MNEDLKSEYTVYKLLSKVFIDKAFGSIELNKVLSDNVKESAYITRFFYGVLDKSIQFDYIIDKLVAKPPKMSVKIFIKMGLYLLRYMDIPDYAAVNKIVQLVKKSGKQGVSGFVNAVLKNSINITLPNITDVISLSINASFPEWLTELLVKQNGFDFTKDFLCHPNDNLTHIRHNGYSISKADFELKYPFITQNSSKYGYYVTHSTMVKLEKQHYVIQSLASSIAVNYFNHGFGEKNQYILDLCSAPGGKAIYIKQLNPSANITACDIHPHRVELIKKYAHSVGGHLDEILLNDACAYNKSFADKFDMVICDVPCSGVGVYNSKPEIVFDLQYSNVLSLQKTQLQIINNAARYVKQHGYLCYSTCTVLKEENEDIIDKFLAENKNFSLVNQSDFWDNDSVFLKLYPHIDNCDGFFAAKLVRNH